MRRTKIIVGLFRKRRVSTTARHQHSFSLTPDNATATCSMLLAQVKKFGRLVGLKNVPPQILKRLVHGLEFTRQVSQADTTVPLCLLTTKHEIERILIPLYYEQEFDSLFGKLKRLFSGVLGSAEYDGGNWEDAQLGEAVSERMHALQVGYAGAICGLGLDAATLALHDTGHLVHDKPIDSARNNIDTQHELTGLPLLLLLQGRQTALTTYYHVIAKQWWTEKPGYADLLSPASQHSLELQNSTAALTKERCARFEKSPHFMLAIQLRLFEDLFGKNPNPDYTTPDLTFYYDAMLLNFQRTMNTCRNPKKQIAKTHEILDGALQRNKELKETLAQQKAGKNPAFK